MARPSEYNEIYISKLEEYLNTTGRNQTTLPTVEGFAEFIGVDTDTINNWADKKNEDKTLVYPEFFGAVKRLKDKQKEQLMNDGLYGGKEVNSTMAIFLLKANHNMIETERKLLAGANGESLDLLHIYKPEKNKE